MYAPFLFMMSNADVSSLVFFVDGPPKENIVIRWVDESGERRDPTTYASVYKWKSK